MPSPKSLARRGQHPAESIGVGADIVVYSRLTPPKRHMLPDGPFVTIFSERPASFAAVRTVSISLSPSAFNDGVDVAVV
jgi:hypothetical protein